MPTDPNATPAPEPDPPEDTQADSAADTAADTQGSSDWESRYKQLQSRTSKVERERDLLRQQVSTVDDEPEEEPEPEEPKRREQSTDRLARDSWTLAEQVYGEQALDAYGRAAKLLDRAVTPADHVAAFEAYHEARIAGAKPPVAAAQAQGEAPQPRIESNRPDAGPDLTEIDREVEAAKAKGDSRGYFAAQLKRLGVR